MSETAGENSGRLLARWQAGDQQAADILFQRYADRLVDLARRHLPRKLNPRLDAEDLVQSVYRSFFVDARENRFVLANGGDLWRLLVTITLNKVRNQIEFHSRGKRSIQQESALVEEFLIQHLPSTPSAEESVCLSEQVQKLMGKLEPLHRRMVELRLQGYNLEEIAQATERSQRTVIRVLEQVKKLLRQELSSDSR